MDTHTHTFKPTYFLQDYHMAELAKEVENGRLLRILVKLGFINERPGRDVVSVRMWVGWWVRICGRGHECWCVCVYVRVCACVCTVAKRWEGGSWSKTRAVNPCSIIVCLLIKRARLHTF